MDSKSKKINDIIQMLANIIRKKFPSITKFAVTNQKRYLNFLVFML